MSKIDGVFESLKKKGEKALIPYITAGDPDLAATKDLIFELEAQGADIIELGIPFSDPIADGPTIQKASMRAFEGGIKLSKILRLIEEVKGKSNGYSWRVEIPLVVMSYYNPIFHYGVERFIRDFRCAGGEGIIVPDLPPDEAEEVLAGGKKYGVDIIFLLAPTSSEERIKKICDASSGYIYYVSVLGVTGTREFLSKSLSDRVKFIKRFTKKPIAVGFGISTPDQARAVASVADGVIVGSAIIKIIEENLNSPQMVKKVGGFLKRLKNGMREA
ncbi:MAG: tryptophan synthase subunit alpha [Candidatus Schekmanbacteria bacterium RBG_16_38_11]|uniref:Tryptophan synthase alpha chain n=1 Tax=Candidatus Schekmanbacteria bacterium RBG_16_38_11 TaxID=1817880 RepID=A0A1F7RSQ1_9BACT|nr:MAG: tryptophan synthase subunit alpha [Candidatus Schekmanbacteria bacterium RBG_16_38_11]